MRIKSEEIIDYYNLTFILNLDLPVEVLETITKNWHRKVFYEQQQLCKIGTLIGIEVNNRYSEVYYIITKNGVQNYVPIWKNLTTLT